MIFKNQILIFKGYRAEPSPILSGWAAGRRGAKVNWIKQLLSIFSTK